MSKREEICPVTYLRDYNRMRYQWERRHKLLVERWTKLVFTYLYGFAVLQFGIEASLGVSFLAALPVGAVLVGVSTLIATIVVYFLHCIVLLVANFFLWIRGDTDFYRMP